MEASPQECEGSGGLNSRLDSEIRPSTRRDLIDGLGEVGLRSGDLVMVHSSMRSVRPILGGPNEMIEALLDAVGGTGTVVMYVDWEDGAQAHPRTDFDGNRGERPYLSFRSSASSQVRRELARTELR